MPSMKHGGYETGSCREGRCALHANIALRMVAALLVGGRDSRISCNRGHTEYGGLRSIEDTAVEYQECPHGEISPFRTCTILPHAGETLKSDLPMPQDYSDTGKICRDYFVGRIADCQGAIHSCIESRGPSGIPQWNEMARCRIFTPCTPFSGCIGESWDPDQVDTDYSSRCSFVLTLTGPGLHNT